MKNIENGFGKVEKIIELTGKLILKIVTVIVGVSIALVVALEQLDYHILSDDPEEDSIEAQKDYIQEGFIEQQYEEYNK